MTFAPDFLRAAIRLLYLCFLEARPPVQGIFVLRYLAGASFGGTLFDIQVWTGAALWGCATWAVYLLNGVTDVNEDRINGSKRPIARNSLGAGTAAAMVVGLALLSLLGSIALGRSVVWIGSTAALLALGWLYSAPPFRLKRWPVGLAAVAVLAALLTYYAGYAGTGGGDRATFAMFTVMMALWMGLIGQTKDLSDVQGDRQTGRKSLPIAWGDWAARLAVSAIATAVGTAFLLAALWFRESLLIPTIIVFFGGVTVAVITLVLWDGSADKKKRRRPYRAFMLTQYAANIAVVAVF
jgi:4-hydroxybenzoate polyprenyltransferase